MIKKEVVCLKCKCNFFSEIDSKGIPYTRICSKCKKKKNRFGRGVASNS